MPRKKKRKFTINPGTTTPPLNTGDYWGCGPLTGGEWRIATRNDTVPSDSQGRGWTGKVYVSSVKLCAPDPPFSNDDGPYGKEKKGRESNSAPTAKMTPV